MTTNTVVWRYRWREQCYSGTLATGGNLLFVGRNDGRLTALDSRTGKQLWEFQTGAGMHAPVSTFDASRQAVRARLLGRQRADRLRARRQRLAVRARRHAAARPSGHAGLAAGRAYCADAGPRRGARRQLGRRDIVKYQRIRELLAGCLSRSRPSNGARPLRQLRILRMWRPPADNIMSLGRHVRSTEP